MTRRLDIKLGCGKEPGPLGDGRCRPDELADPIPGDAARLGGVARPKPESESKPYDHITMHALVKKIHQNKEKSSKYKSHQRWSVLS
jgi:hypothetical protein